ncbi:MAG: hypothetical protein HWD61_04310 [Parachlamydiaceae bacterium]|nr:MAG: hypothetical protein HWD61_04310 [Parachlamydiaceae bacterium]
MSIRAAFFRRNQSGSNDSCRQQKLDQEQHFIISKNRFEKLSVEEKNKEADTKSANVTKVKRASASAKAYLTTHPMAAHGIYKASLFYDQIELNDGSIWQVYYASDRSIVSRWMLLNDQVIIRPGTIFDATDYLLVSQRTGESIAVDLIGMEEIIGDPSFMGQRLWIHNIDLIYDYFFDVFYYQIVLNDGSIWELDSYDNYIGSYMYPGDVVFVGVDNTFGSPTYNILIHFNTLEYVHADCIIR